MEENKNAVQVFSNPQFGEIRTCGTAENPMFCLADLCRVLELSNPSMVLQRLEDGVISTYPILDSFGRAQKANFVNEDGFYDVVLESRKPIARAFRKWVTSEVLPSIRKTGGYGVEKEEMIQIPRSELEAIEYGYRKLWERCQRQANVIKRQGKKNTKLLAQMEEAKLTRIEKKESMRIEFSKSAEDFVTDMDLIQSDKRTPFVTIFALYLRYCKNKGVKQASNKALSLVLSSRGFEKGRTNYGTYFYLTRKALPYDPSVN